MILPSKSKRIFLLDVVRGLAVFIMIIVDAPPTPEIYQIWQHADWEGLTIADFAFPGFVFAMGMSAAVSTSRRPADFKKIFKRAVILFIIGLLFNNVPYVFAYFLWDNFSAADFYNNAVEHLRIFGILQRLALTYALGMLIVKFLEDDKKIICAATLLLIVSSLGFHLYAAENPFDVNNNLYDVIDLAIVGANHMYTPIHDPEGLYGTLSSTAEMLFGFLAGKSLIDNSSADEKFKVTAIFGAVLLLIGGAWSFVDIISKNLWTAPFSLITAGIFALVTAFLLRGFEVIPKLKSCFQPLASLGKNPLVFFLASNIGLIFFIVSDLWGKIFAATIMGFISVPFSALLFCWLWAIFWALISMAVDKSGVVIKI